MLLPLRRFSKSLVRDVGLCLLVFVAGCGTSAFLHVTPVRFDEKVRVLLGGGGNSTILLHGRDAFVTDLKLGDYALKLRREVEVELGRRVSRILLTHAHSDHVSGLFAFPDTPAVLVHPNAKRQLENAGRRANWVEVEREVQLQLGGEQVKVLYLGVGHTNGDLVALLPDHQLLVSGDLFADGLEPVVDESSGGNLLDWVDTSDRLLELSFTQVVPGHGPVVPRAHLERFSQYLHALKAEVQGAMASGKSEDQAAKEVTLHEFDADIRSQPFLSSREKNVRRMWKALHERATLAAHHE